MMRTNRNDWWRQSVVKRTLPSVKQDIQNLLSQSPYLQQSEPGAHVALFHRSEIITGARLGKGGFSYVYEIVDFELNPEYSALLTLTQQQLREHYRNETREGRGHYAIKYLQERLLNDPKSFQCATTDLAIEAAYMSTLNHPNILSVRGLPIHGLDALAQGFHDGYFIVLDRLEETLDKTILSWKKHDLPILGKAGYALQLASALQYLHRKNIIFRDLKPNNLGFIDGTLKILDFGLCREMPVALVPDQLFEMSGVGTRRYMAVEIVNTSFYNHKADVYSWAMVFFEMLNLEKPYPCHSVDDHCKFVCQGGERPPLQKHWPLELQNLLKHSWTTSIPNRLSMEEVECLLRTYLECCRVLDATNDSPHFINLRCYNDTVSSTSKQFHLPNLDNTITMDTMTTTRRQEAFLLKDHRMSMTFSQTSIADNVLESSVFDSAAGATGTDVSSLEEGHESISTFDCSVYDVPMLRSNYGSD